MSWPDRRFTELLKIEHPIVLAPMAGAINFEIAVEVAEAGGLGSIPCAMLDLDQVRDQFTRYRAHTAKPVNLGFFCHTPPELSNERESAWRERLAPYYRELKIDPSMPIPNANRRPFDAAYCDLVVDLKPEVVSFHFGLPEAALFERVKQAGIVTFSSATTVAEARWLEERGVDVIIAQGYEAGGHRGIFLSDDIATQPGTFALVPQIADAVTVPVIAAGAVTDARGIAAAFMLGAAAVQMGTAFLFCPEAKISAPYRAALKGARDDGTALTNLMTGRPARGLMNRLMRDLGPISEAPAFPGSGDFTALWSGQAAALGVEMPARALMQKLTDEAQALLR
jgi:nitronate monooxygenase